MSRKPSWLNAEQLARQYGVPILDPDRIQPMPEALARVPAPFAREHQLLPISVSGSCLVVAMNDPSDLRVIEKLSRISSLPEIEPVVTDPASLREAIDRCYPVAQA